MKLGDVFSAKVRGLTSEGSGVLDHSSGRVVFVPGAWIEEEVEVKITAIKSQFAHAQLRKIVKAHPLRRAAPCEFHGFGKTQCGGCPWQFVEYAAQLAAKHQRVEQTIGRISQKTRILPILPAPAELGYRNRAQFKTDGQQLGFVAAGTNVLAPINDCRILNDNNREQLRMLLGQLPNREWQQAAKRQWVTVDINETESSVNQRLPFRQGNSAQNEVMRLWLREHLDPLDKMWPVLELFAGSGNFTQVISELGYQTITAVEVVAEAVAQLEQCKFSGVTTQALDLYQAGVLGRLLKRGQAKILVLDPPRDGIKFASEILAKQNALAHIFYISCDLATFSRDAKTLVQQGFDLHSVQPLDLFPQTPHIELMARFSRA